MNCVYVFEMLKIGDFEQENIFDWQFAIRGPRDTEFEGGIYHGRIQLPAEYPFKPPSFMLLTVVCSCLAGCFVMVALGFRFGL